MGPLNGEAALYFALSFALVGLMFLIGPQRNRVGARYLSLCCFAIGFWAALEPYEAGTFQIAAAIVAGLAFALAVGQVARGHRSRNLK